MSFIAIAVTIAVAVAIAGGGAPDIGGTVEHEANHSGIGPGQGLDPLEDLGGGGKILADHVDDPIHMARASAIMAQGGVSSTM